MGEEVDPAGHEQRVSTLPRAPPLLERGAVARDRAWDVGGAPRRGLSCGRRAGAGEARRSTAVGCRGRAVAVAVADPPSLMCCLWCHQTTPPAPAAAPAAEGPRHAGTRATGSGPGDAEAVCWGPSGPFPGGGRAGETLPCDRPCLGLGEAPTRPGASPPEGTRGGPPNRGATRGGSPAPRPGRLPRGCRRVRREQPE